jgi:serine/threonine-protein kinase
MSWGLAASQYFGAFHNTPAEFVDRDQVGLGMVVIWIFTYSVLVPTAPRRALVALVASASSVPLIYLASVADGSAPPLPTMNFFLTFVGPYIATVVSCYVIVRIVHRLGQEVRAAQRLGSYRLEERIGRGGMGDVWRAKHHLLARPAAVKLIRKDAFSDDTYAEAVARFEREAQATATLQSPHTVELYDFGVADDGTIYYVMELLDGADLEVMIDKYGPMPAARVINILTQACESLGEAHRRGLVHRDIKPANLLLCEHAYVPDFVKVLDFGLVKRPMDPTMEGDLKITRADHVAGTPSYMAPEQLLGETIDGRTDIYALGCVAYWLLTGQPVFDAKNTNAMLVAHVHDMPVPPSERTELPVPSELDQAVLACLAKDPLDRPDAAALARQLRSITTDRAWTPERAAAWWEKLNV